MNNITCVDCIYKLDCPAGRSYNNAACLTIRKGISDLTEDERRKLLEGTLKYYQSH